MKIKCPTIQFPKECCVFYNHETANCTKGSKCNRNHTCPACGGEHTLSECPDLQETQ